MGIVSSRNLKGVIRKLKRGKNLNRKCMKILNVLRKDGVKILGEDPEVFLEMVKKAHCLIEYPSYLEIIQMMADTCSAIQYKSHKLLESLLLQMNDKDNMTVFTKHQEVFLSLIMVLTMVDSSLLSRSECLRRLILNAEYSSAKKCWLWTRHFLDTLTILVSKGADLTRRPPTDDGSGIYDMSVNYNGSFLHHFLQGITKILTEENRLPPDSLNQYQGIISRAVEANPAVCDIVDEHRQTVLHILSKAVYDKPDLGQNLLNIFPILTTEQNVNHYDCNSVTPYYWILAGLVSHDSSPDIFSRIEAIFLTKGTANENGRPGVQFVAGMKLKKTIKTLKEAKDLDHHGREILQLLAECGFNVLSREPRLFRKMIGKAHCLIGNPFYLEIIQKMVEMYKKIERKPQEGPLQCLVEQMEDWRKKRALCVHQEELLPLIKILMNVQESSHSRTYCLRAICINIKRFKMTDELRETLQLLMAKGANPAQMPRGRSVYGEGTVLHIIAKAALKHQDLGSGFLTIVPLLTTEENKDIQDEDGQTVLHILARAALENQKLGNALLTIFSLLTTERNVNLSDKDSATPFSWILAAKARWGKSQSEKQIFSEMEEIFLSKGADADLAKGTAIRMPLYRWAGQELSDRGCTSDKLDNLLNGMQPLQEGSTLLNGSALCFMKEFEEEVWENLWRMRNAKCIATVMEILRILVANESTAQHAWTSILKYSRYSSGRVKEVTLSVMEILCLCAERGAQATDEELQRILGRANAMTRNDDLTVAFLKTLIALHRKKPFACHLQFLGDFYVVSQEILQLGRQLVYAVYGTMENCLKAGKLIDSLLFISCEQEKILEERFIEESIGKNWLHRSPVHFCVMLLYCKSSLKCIPQNILKRYINAKDIHGCTPLHLAHLHHNKQAVQFLIDHGANQDVTDKFGKSPESLVSPNTIEDHPDVKYKELCHNVLEAKCGMRPLLVHSKVAAQALSDQVNTLFERLVQGTQFETAAVELAGSMREKLKARRLDEVDVLLKFEGERGSRYEFSIAGFQWEEGSFLKKLLHCLRKRLAKISWEGIHLRPISVHGPWKFLREGMTVSVDVVALIVSDEKIRSSGYITQKEAHELQGELLRGERPLHRKMAYCTLEIWNNKYFKTTYFAYEWDIIASLPTTYRQAIVLAKTLVQAYELCRGDSLRVKMPVTTYTIKTALFYILAYNSSQLHFMTSEGKALMNALGLVEGNESEVKTRARKLEYNPQPKWATDEDVDQHGEVATVQGRKIFTLIKRLVQQNDMYYAPQGWKLNSYWDRVQPVVEIEDYGEAECICDICDCALECLKNISLLRR